MATEVFQGCGCRKFGDAQEWASGLVQAAGTSRAQPLGATLCSLHHGVDILPGPADPTEILASSLSRPTPKLAHCFQSVCFPIAPE